MQFKIFKIVQLLLLPVLLYGQVGLKIETENGYTSNAFATFDTRPDYYTSISATLNHDWLGENYGIRGFYEGDYSAFNKYKDRNFFSHFAGLRFYQYLKDDGSRLNIGVSLGKKFHSESYEWYERQEANAYFNVKLVLSDQFYGYAGATIRWREYSILDAFSYWQNAFFLRFSRFFNSGTTLILETNLLSKNYFPANSVSNIDYLPEIVTLGEGNSRQLVGVFKIAQAVTLKTGLSFQALLRNNLENTIRYLGSLDGLYYSDEELFDDVFGYKSHEYMLNLKNHLPWKMIINTGSAVAFKNYEQRLALDLEGNPFSDNRLRQDDRWTFWLSLEKRFQISSAMQPLSFSVNWTLINNISNDPYYDYESNYISFTLSQGI